MISDRYQGNKLITELHNLAFDFEACTRILQRSRVILLFLLASSFFSHAQQTTERLDFEASCFGPNLYPSPTHSK